MYIFNRAPARGSKSHAGVAGKENQDSFALFRIGPGDQRDWFSTPLHSTYVAAVADGVTSQAAGANASQIAIHALQAALRQPAHELTPAQRLDDAFRAANQAILDAGDTHPKLAGMSTTLVVALIQGRQLFLAHVGDSRAYLVRGRGIYQLTRDHTWVQQAIDAGRLTPDEARHHANRHTLIYYLGVRRGLYVDHSIISPTSVDAAQPRQIVSSLPLEQGDAILLCSDGVTEKLTTSDIHRIVARHRYRPKAAAGHLINAALARQEADNITAIMLTTPPTRVQQLRDTVFAPRRVAGLAATLGALLLVVALWMLLRVTPTPMENGMRIRQLMNTAATPQVQPTALRQVRVGAIEEAVTSRATQSAVAPAEQSEVSPRPATHPGALETDAPAKVASLVRTTPQPTTLFDSSPTSTRIPPQLHTHRVSRVTSTPLPSASAFIPTATLFTAASATWLVVLDAPFEPILHGRQVFRWIPNFELPDEYLFEVVFWEEGQDPLLAGFSPSGAFSATAILINLDKAADYLPQLQPQRNYVWSVFLVEAANPQHRMKALSQGRPFVLGQNSAGSEAESSSGE